jgi:RNA polymerase sigma factor (sigma-70 family)
MEEPNSAAEQGQPDGLEIPDWGGLVARIREGDSAAMEQLYAFFEKGVRWFFYRSLGREELEDRVHDCFVIVTKAIQAGDLRDPERLMGYVRTVVRRQIAAGIQDVSSRRRSEVDFSESTFSLADWKADPEQSLAVREREAIGKKVLEEISGRDREVLMRFYVQEQPYERICEEMGLTYNQFRLLKSRAKARFGKLGKKMAENFGTGRAAGSKK